MYDYYGMSDNFASTSNFTFPTSSTRDERHTPSTPTSPRYDPLRRLAPKLPRYVFEPDYAHYLVPPARSVAPGLHSDGTLTTDHPVVRQYLNNLHIVSPQEGRREPNEKWWTKGIREPSVNEVLDEEGLELDDFQSECIFVLAALKVLNHPRHPKHFTLWGREWAPRTAERVHRVLHMKPCPIASSHGWLSVSQSLWIVDAAQASAFPVKKEGKKANNGMLLRKRRAGAQAAAVAVPIEAVFAAPELEGEPPRKRVRTTRGAVAAEKEKEKETKAASTAPDFAAPVEADSELLPELALPDLTVSLNSSERASPALEAEEHVAKSMKLELMGVDAPLSSSVLVASPSTLATASTSPASSSTMSPPEPTRRSARQARRRPTTTSPAANADEGAMSPTSDITALDSPSAPPSVLDADTQEAERPAAARARSASSSCRSSTAVSDLGLSGAETVVEGEVEEDKEHAKASAGSKRKRGADKSVDEEKLVAVRASTRVRKPAAKKAEADEDAAVEQQGLAADEVSQKVAATAKRPRQRSTRRV